jgi:hypothetical protein
MPEVLRVLSFVRLVLHDLVSDGLFLPCGIFQGLTTSVSCHHMPGYPGPLMSMLFCHPPPCGKLSCMPTVWRMSNINVNVKAMRWHGMPLLAPSVDLKGCFNSFTVSRSRRFLSRLRVPPTLAGVAS